MYKIKNIFSSGKTLLIAVVAIAGISAPAIVPVVCPQYTYLIPTIEKVADLIGIDFENEEIK
jgi:hypothetical protein